MQYFSFDPTVIRQVSVLSQRKALQFQGVVTIEGLGYAATADHVVGRCLPGSLPG
jgi:hypothetical protein